MADHYYSVSSVGKALQRVRHDIVVGTSGTGANPLEMRVTDGTATNRQVAEFLETLADYFKTRDPQVVVAGTVKV